MIYLSLKDKIESNSVKKTIEDLDKKQIIYDANKLTVDSSKKLKKSKIVICNFDIDKIKEYLVLNKIVIALKRNKVSLSDEETNILYNNKVYTYSGKNELREILSYIIKRENIRNKVFLVSSLIITLCILTVLKFDLNINKTKILNSQSLEIAKKEEKQKNKKDEKVDFKKENIVFYGDSITDFYNLEKFYENLPVINSGTSGFQTKDLLNLIKERVYIYIPTKVFIMIGTNDIAFTDLTNEELVNNIKEIVNRIKDNRPKTEIFVESIYPINRKTDNDIVDSSMVNIRKNERIKEINKKIKKMCEQEKVTYINMYDLLTDENGDLNLDYTVEGLHINDKGYEVITKKLMEYIEPNSKNKNIN